MDREREERTQSERERIRDLRDVFETCLCVLFTASCWGFAAWLLLFFSPDTPGENSSIFQGFGCQL